MSGATSGACTAMPSRSGTARARSSRTGISLRNNAFMFAMSEGAPKYISRIRIVRERGPIRKAFLPAEAQPVIFGTHDEIREHYGTAPGQYPDHATTLDYVV